MSPLLHSSMSSSAVLRPVGALPRRTRPNHQIRTLKIGLWSSYLEPGFQKEMQHRQRALRYKYLNTINRKLSWDRQSPILFKPGVTIKGFMCSAWRGQLSGSEDNWLFNGRRKKGRQADRNDIDDALMHARSRKSRAKSFTFSTPESAPIFLHRSLRSGVYPSTVNARLNTNSNDIHAGINNLKNHGPLYAGRYAAPLNTTEQDGFQPAASIGQSDVEYVIDPITNRKTHKKASSTTKSQTVVENGMKGGLAGLFKAMNDNIGDQAHLAKQENTLTTHHNSDQPPQDHPKSYDASATSSPAKPILRTEEFRRSCSVQEGLRDYDERVSYGPACTDKPYWTDETSQQASVKDGLSEYDQVTSYEAGAFNGETQRSQQLNEDGLKSYDDKVSYEPGAFNGQVSVDQELAKDGLDEYDNSMSYEPGAFNGELSAEQDVVKDGLKEYDDLTSYEPEEFNGKIPGNSEPPSEQILNDYDKTMSYEPGPFNGQGSDSEIPTYENGLKEYDNSISYEPGSFNGKETNGQNFSTEDGLKDYDNVTSYEPGVFNGSLSERQSSTEFNDGLSDYDNSNSYEAGQFNGKSQPSDFASSEDGLKAYDEAHSYEPTTFNDMKHESASQQNDSRTENPSYHKIARYLRDIESEAPEPRDRSSTVLPNAELDAEKRARRQDLDQEFETAEESLDTSASKIRDRMYAADATKKANAQDKLSSNLSGDSPGESKNSWVATNDSTGALLQKLQDKLQSVASKLEPSGVKLPDEEKYIDGRAEASDFARTPDADKKRIETSFDRIRSPSSPTGGSSGGNNAKDSATELEEQVKQIYESKYGKITPEHRQSPPPAAAASGPTSIPTKEPTNYKILAYDPTMQSIDIAETSSIVPDSASPLTPAEVLLRLSNPAKFFPHFGPLQAQGYEIVSGSGDVLVFRKVRDASVISTKSPAASHPERSRTTTNPIDGMQPIAATGNFASPTGFVNYDRPAPTEEPPFRSNIDMRREEEVFSGRSSWSEEGSEQASRKKMGLGKRALVGGVMVGGASYAVGVVSDYFQSGGRNGKGPQGF